MAAKCSAVRNRTRKPASPTRAFSLSACPPKGMHRWRSRRREGTCRGCVGSARRRSHRRVEGKIFCAVCAFRPFGRVNRGKILSPFVGCEYAGTTTRRACIECASERGHATRRKTRMRKIIGKNASKFFAWVAHALRARGRGGVVGMLRGGLRASSRAAAAKIFSHRC